MKKYILVGVVLILAGLLWFLIMPAREGLINPECWGAAIDAAAGKFVDGSMAAFREASVKFNTLDAAKEACGTDTACTGIQAELFGADYTYAKFLKDPTLIPSPPDLPPGIRAGFRLFYPKKPCASTAAPPAPPASGCPTNGEGITSVAQSGGQTVRLYTQTECAALKGNWVGNGKKSWGMQTDMVGECIGVPGQNIGFCNQSAPPSAAARAIETPPLPAPAPPPAPAPTPPIADPQIGTLISLLQQDIMGRKSSLLNTANNPAIPVGSLLTQTTVDPNWKPIPNATIPGPNYSALNKSMDPLDEIPKSSLVPCTCPTYTMSCPVHAGSRPSSQAPGDADSALSRAQDQYDMMRPFNKTDDVPGFLNTFSNFGN